MTVILYSTPTCAPCRVAEKRLSAAGIPVNKIDLTTEPAVLDDLKRRLGRDTIQTPLFEYAGSYYSMGGLRDLMALASHE